MLLYTGYPDGHNESTDDEDQQIQHLKLKVDAGAEFVITQLFYDVESFLNWYKKVRDTGISHQLPRRYDLHQGIGVKVPIIPGIMPIQSYASFMRLTKLCGTRVPPQLMDEINPIRVSNASLH